MNIKELNPKSHTEFKNTPTVERNGYFSLPEYRDENFNFSELKDAGDQYLVHFVNGIVHHESLPAIIYLSNNKIFHISYVLNGKEDSSNGKPSEHYFDNGNVFTQEFYKNGELHRDDSPAVIEYRIGTFNNKYHVHTEKYYKNGLVHRKNLPAVIIYSSNNIPIVEKYFVNGKCHRLDGPAVSYHMGKKWYYVNDQEIDQPVYALNKNKYELMKKLEDL